MRFASICCGFRIVFCYNFAVTKFLSRMINETIKKNICRFRKAKGYTQEQMAKMIGKSETHFRNIESGSTLLVNPVLETLASIFDMDVEDLMVDYDKFEVCDILEEDSAPYGNSKKSLMTQNLKLLEEKIEYQKSVELKGSQLEELRLSNNDLRTAIALLKKAKGL